MRLDILILTLMLTVCSCRQKEQLITDRELEEKIRNGVTSGDKILDLGVIADFSWDSLLIITPYANFDDTEKNFNIDLSRTEHVNIESRDDINQLIFYDKGEPARMVEYPRIPGDFAGNEIKFIKRDSAKFDIALPTDIRTRKDFVTLRRRK